jgi:hypothetical protein
MRFLATQQVLRQVIDMKLQGRKVKSTVSDKTLVWEAKEVTNGFGVCQPSLRFR